MPEGIRVGPNIAEEHPGYQESGDSEIVPTEGPSAKDITEGTGSVG